ncbi:MAG: AAA family ATPase [Bacillaceae bacterium]|nr:AAA family ATPase [Bacillaceae bacterium]
MTDLKKIPQNVTDARKVNETQLRKVYDPAQFHFETTDDIEALSNGIVGQNRAVRAMEFGLQVEQSGYNLFVIGPSGSGKTHYTRSKVEETASRGETPDDWCYVYHFKQPDQPLALSFPAGGGQAFKQEMEELVSDVEHKVQTVFSGDEFEQRRRELIEEYDERIEALWKQVENSAREQNLAIERGPQGIVTIPLMFGRPIPPEEFKQLPEVTRDEITKKRKKVETEVYETALRVDMIRNQMEKEIHRLRKEMTETAIKPLFDPLYEKYKDSSKVYDYLNMVEEDMAENYHLFQETGRDNENVLAPFFMGEQDTYKRYRVNLLVDHSKTEGAPVVFESNPSYYNLFGKEEYRGSFGTVSTDFTMIKPGALHLANGGYLILQANELLTSPMSWHGLKRCLRTKTLRIENMMEERGLVASAGLKPEEIPLNVKVVLIGNPFIYQLLAQWDEDFHKLFKVKVDFDTEMDGNSEHIQEFVSYMKNLIDRNKLKPFHREAVAEVIAYSSRLVSDQKKMSTRFGQIADLLIESHFWAGQDASDIVQRRHVQRAIEEKAYRSNRIEEKIRERIADGTIMVDTEGAVVGQINGLSVLNMGDYMFGQPNRITARTYVGRKGIINIERETSLSGHFHDKGLLILSGYLASQFARNRPLPLSASITFEQSYSMVDGDSASSTELYALLSSLSRVPIRQGIAVTGSVNQRGEIQPIGGVNEKIEGFYYVCKARGLTGEQGVIIPHQNVRNLMLKEEVVEAVKQGQFHIWAVKTIKEGIEILTGVEAGEEDEHGRYPEGTINHRIEQRLDEMYESIRKLEKGDS